MGGKLINKSEVFPFTSLDKSVPVIAITLKRIKRYISHTFDPPIDAISTTIIPCCAAQGIEMPSRATVISLSLSVGRILVVMVPIVVHPKPSINGITALPFNPIFLSISSQNTLILGKYPESSRIDIKI